MSQSFEFASMKKIRRQTPKPLPSERVKQIDSGELIHAFSCTVNRYRKLLRPRQINAIVLAAQIVANELNTPFKRAEPGMGVENWLQCDEQSPASEFMCRILTGRSGVNPIYSCGGRQNIAPADPVDLGRCFRMMEAVGFLEVPEVMRQCGPMWNAIVERWGVLVDLYAIEQREGTAPRLEAEMKRIYDLALTPELIDPGKSSGAVTPLSR